MDYHTDETLPPESAWAEQYDPERHQLMCWGGCRSPYRGEPLVAALDAGELSAWRRWHEHNVEPWPPAVQSARWRRRNDLWRRIDARIDDLLGYTPVVLLLTLLIVGFLAAFLWELVNWQF